MKQEYALIVAGGKGMRFGAPVPKQFLELNGKPVIMHTIEAFYRYRDDITVVLVLPGEDEENWMALVREHDFQLPVILQSGGATRFHSVKRGLEKIETGFVAIHDGVRPLVTPEIIATSFQLARQYGNAVASVPLKDSIRIASDPEAPEATKAMDRSLFRLVQTPQTFDVSLIREAYANFQDTDSTDDARVAEASGAAIHLFPGSYENIKITTPEDLAIASALMALRPG